MLGAGAGTFACLRLMHAMGQKKDAPVRARVGPRLRAGGEAERGWGWNRREMARKAKVSHCPRAALVCTMAPGHVGSCGEAGAGKGGTWQTQVLIPA